MLGPLRPHDIDQDALLDTIFAHRKAIEDEVNQQADRLNDRRFAMTQARIKLQGAYIK